jgi:hypothetical protein
MEAFYAKKEEEKASGGEEGGLRGAEGEVGG